MLQDSDKYKQFTTQILTIILDILNGESAPSNCLNVLEQKNSITILLQYTNSTSPQNRILVLRILSQLAMHQLELLQSVLISTEDHLPSLLSLIHDKNKIILQEFLDFVCVSIENNPNFQQIVAFNILDSLVSLLRQGNDKTFSALIAILRNNSISQTMFYSSGYIDAVAPYVRSKTSSSLSFLRSLFQDESFPKHQKNLLSTTFFAALLEVSIDDLRFLEILSLATHNSKELTDKVTEKGTLLEIVQKMFDNLADEHLKFVQDFDGKSDICKLISENFSKINDDNLSNILRICEVLDIYDNDCRLVFSKKDEKGESFLNKILQMLEGPNMSTILVFLAVECWECNSACYNFFDDSTKIGNTYKYLEIVCAAENISMNSLSLFSSYMILASLMQFSDNYIPNVVSLISKESLISKIVQLRTTVENEFKDNEIAHYLIQISFNFVGDSPKIEEEQKIIDPNEKLQEEPEEIKEIKPNQENLNPKTEEKQEILNTKSEIKPINLNPKSEVKEEETKEDINKENEEETDSNLYRKFIIEKSKRQEAEKRCEDLQNQIKYNTDEESKRIQSIQNTFSSELEKKQNLIQKLESQIDTITINSQKEISDLKKKQMQLENQNLQEMSKIKSSQNSEILKKCSELKEEVNKVRSEIELFESSNKALLDSKLDELSEM
ncbi:A-type inclusion protein-related family, partial [Trichomonas vaginalis G3]